MDPDAPVPETRCAIRRVVAVNNRYRPAPSGWLRSLLLYVAWKRSNRCSIGGALLRGREYWRSGDRPTARRRPRRCSQALESRGEGAYPEAERGIDHAINRRLDPARPVHDTAGRYVCLDSSLTRYRSAAGGSLPPMVLAGAWIVSAGWRSQDCRRTTHPCDGQAPGFSAQDVRCSAFN